GVRVQVHQRHHLVIHASPVRSPGTCRNLVAGKDARVNCLWRSASGIHCSLLCDLGRREKPCSLAVGGHPGFEQAGIERLMEILESSEEKQFLPALVHTSSRNTQRSVQISTRLVTV